MYITMSLMREMSETNCANCDLLNVEQNKSKKEIQEMKKKCAILQRQDAEDVESTISLITGAFKSFEEVFLREEHEKEARIQALITKLKKEMEQLTDNTNYHVAAKLELEKELEQEKEAKEKAQAESKPANDERLTLHKKIHDLERELEQTEAERQSFEKEFHDLETKLEQAEQGNEKAQAAVNKQTNEKCLSLEEQKHDLQIELSDCKKKLSSEEEVVATMSEYINCDARGLLAENEACNITILQLKTELKQQKERTEADIKQVKDNCLSLKDENHDLQKELRREKRGKEKAQAVAKEANDERQASEEELHDLQRKDKQQRTELHRLRGDLVTLTNESDDLRRNRNQVSMDLVDRQQDFDRQQDVLNELRRTVDRLQQHGHQMAPHVPAAPAGPVDFFHPQELMEMVVGIQDYDFNELKEGAEYLGEYFANHPVIQNFWNVFNEFDMIHKKKFLVFLTGTDRVPLTGIRSLNVKIQPVSGGLNNEHLPVAHTCFNLLDLPRYPSKEIMKQKLEQAISYSSGFGLA